MMNKEEKIVNGYYQSNIKTSRNEDSVYVMRYASQQMLIEDLQQKINKAIEYINKLKEYPYLEKYYVGELLEILGGKE